MLDVEKWLQNGLDNIQNLLLDNEEKWDQFFHASSELKNEKIRTIAYLPHEDKIRAKHSFQILKENYQAGLLFERDGDKWSLKEQFCYGTKEEASNFSMKLPDAKTSQVLKIPAARFNQFEDLSLPLFQQDTSALLFKPCKDYTFILFSDFPKVILYYLSDETHEFLLKSFAY